MKLFMIDAPNPRRVRFFLAEKGVEVECETVDIQSDAIRRTPYYEACLSGQFPVLELDDDSFLSESVAICRYFEGLHPEPNLLGREPIEQGRIEMWNRRLELGLFRYTADYFQHTAPFFANRIEQNAAYAKTAQSKAIEQLGMIDRALAERPFIAGDRFSIADITAFVVIDLATPSVLEVGRETPHLERWVRESAERACFQTA
jgi:glutathione S-transferase